MFCDGCDAAVLYEDGGFGEDFDGLCGVVECDDGSVLE